MKFIDIKILRTNFNSQMFCYKNFPCYITDIIDNRYIIRTLPIYTVVKPLSIIDNNNNEKTIYYKCDRIYIRENDMPTKVIYNIHFYENLKYTPFSVYKIKKINKDDLTRIIYKNNDDLW